MTGVWFLLCHLLSLAISALAVDLSKIQVYPESGRVSGVFLASFKPMQNKNPVYAFNASQARLVCQSLNVVIASNAQVEEAYKNGLETCRFGWIDEQIAVLPRISPSKPCGQERVGVIRWNSAASRLFDTFCFNSSDIKMEVRVMTTNVPTTNVTATSKPTAGAPSASSPTPAPLPHTPPPLPPITQSARPPPSLASTLSPPHSTSTSPASPSLPPLPRTTPPAPRITAERSPPLGVVPTALLILAGILLLLAAVITLWYYRTNRTRMFPFCKRGQRKEDMETEVWENFCQTDLKEPQTDIELDGCRNDSNDLGLEGGPETKAVSP